MILYHGTSTEFLASILNEGIKPRSETQQPSNWEGQIESKPDCVYLSDAYPVDFALNAANNSWEPVVLKVDVPEGKLCPDEDFVAWALSRANHTDWRATIPAVDPHDYRALWKSSLECSGNVAAPRVLASRILAHRTIPVGGNEALLLNIGGDAFPTPMNYRFFSDYYRNCMAALFEHDLDKLHEVVN